MWEKAENLSGSQFQAIFGEADVAINLSDVLEFYIGHIRDEFIGLDARTKDKKLKPKYNAINKIIEFIGDDIEIPRIQLYTSVNVIFALSNSILSSGSDSAGVVQNTSPPCAIKSVNGGMTTCAPASLAINNAAKESQQFKWFS